MSLGHNFFLVRPAFFWLKDFMRPDPRHKAPKVKVAVRSAVLPAPVVLVVILGLVLLINGAISGI